MNEAFIILWMVFFHIVDDFYLQKGVLASIKQKSWWEENAPEEQYKRDYVWALLMHSFSWSFMVMLPVAYSMNFCIDSMFLLVFGFNVYLHAATDHAKANEKTINLWSDQLIHMAQIAYTAIYLI